MPDEAGFIEERDLCGSGGEPAPSTAVPRCRFSAVGGPAVYASIFLPLPMAERTCFGKGLPGAREDLQRLDRVVNS